MKKPAIIFCLLLSSFAAFAQEVLHPPILVPSDKTETKQEEKIYDIVSIEHIPEYPGGDTALTNYIARHLVYPQSSLDRDIQGRVIIGFIVEKDGTMSSISVKKGIEGDGGMCNREALRAVRSLASFARFKPGTQGGKAVRVNYLLPIRFKLSEPELLPKKK